MDWFKTVSNFYTSGFYTNDQVKVFVTKSKITSDQYQQITGQAYTA